MPDTTVKKLPDGFTFEGINMYGQAIYWYNGKPVYANNSVFPQWNTPVNFGAASIPTPPLLASPPPAGQGSKPPGSTVVPPILFAVNWLELVSGAGNGCGYAPPSPTPPNSLQIPTLPTEALPVTASWWVQAAQWFSNGGGISVSLPGFFGPLIEGYDIPDSSGRVGS